MQAIVAVARHGAAAAIASSVPPRQYPRHGSFGPGTMSLIAAMRRIDAELAVIVDAQIPVLGVGLRQETMNTVKPCSTR